MDKINLPNNYHNFSDKRSILGLPNAMNVGSNLFILLPAIYLLQKQKKMTLLSSHIIYLFLASSYYHINPTNKSIVPDMVGVVTLNIVVLSYFIDPYIFIMLYVLGIFSVFYWYKTNDLRLYIAILLGCPLYIFYKLYDNKQIRPQLYTIIFIGVLLRVLEHNDSYIYKLSNQTISGHTLKHILAYVQLMNIIQLLENTNNLKRPPQNYTIYGEVAKNKKRGLMNRKKPLQENQGMLFQMNYGLNSMWMKDTYIPLDIIFLDESMNIVGFIENAQPLSEKSLQIQEKSAYIIEVSSGTILREDLRMGDTITFIDSKLD